MLTLHTVLAGRFPDFQEQMACVKLEVCWRQACPLWLLRGKEEEEEPSSGHPPDPRLESDSLGPVSKLKIGKHSLSGMCQTFQLVGKIATLHLILFSEG